MVPLFTFSLLAKNFTFFSLLRINYNSSLLIVSAWLSFNSSGVSSSSPTLSSDVESSSLSAFFVMSAINTVTISIQNEKKKRKFDKFRIQVTRTSEQILSYDYKMRFWNDVDLISIHPNYFLLLHISFPTIFYEYSLIWQLFDKHFVFLFSLSFYKYITKLAWLRLF